MYSTHTFTADKNAQIHHNIHKDAGIAKCFMVVHLVEVCMDGQDTTRGFESKGNNGEINGA